ncbi:LuxR C-terminal-related transcriptional regulator [Longispora sp. K20-0274]|uniref:helix-turn-helix transcriptional regulator n=1 Tax=Longispora sp. K20-0274 TaxID=3088255 RepID=UPI00399AE730
MLEMLGLSPGALTVYQAILAHPTNGVDALPAHTSLTVAQVAEALDELADLALLTPSPNADGGLRPVRPEVGLTALLARAEADAAAQQAQIEATRAAIAAIAAEHHYGRESVVRLEGLDAVRTRLEELQALTVTECLSLNPGGAHRPDALAAGRHLNQEALERGVAIRAVCRDSFRNDADTLAYARWLTDLGGQMRTTPTVSMPLVIIDRVTAIVPLDPTNPRAGALEVTSPGILAALCALFEQAWAAATPFGDLPAADEHGCTPTERALLTLIATGHTDVATAHKLGVSLRTVRRTISDLMHRLNASSRFQAGVNATKNGWI